MKYLKTYNQINEGLRDMMKPKSDEDILRDTKDLSNNKKIELFIKYGLDDKYFPRNSDGWCVYEGDLDINYIISDYFLSIFRFPNKFIVNGGLSAPLSGLNKLPDDLVVNGYLDCSFNLLTELPKGLKVQYEFLLTDNMVKKLPDDLVVGGTLYITNNKIPPGTKKPVGVNEMID